MPVKENVVAYYMPAKKAKKYHHGDLQRALLDAALRKVEESRGPEGVSLAALAKDLGVSQAAPYRHFADRDALLAAVATEAFQIFTRALLVAGSKRSARSRLYRLCAGYIAFGTSRQGLYRLMFDSPALANAYEGALKEASQESFGVLVEALSGEARERRATQIWVTLHGIVMLANCRLLSDCESEEVRIQELLEDLLSH